MHRYPQGTVATPDDMRSSRWRTAVGSAEKAGYFAIWQTLSKAAGSAMDEARAAESKVLWLLADACSMMLKPRNVNQPFAPVAVFDDRRSAIPDDFSTEDIAFFAAIAADLDNDMIRARICDLVWLCGSPRDVTFALLAIDAYRAIPLTSETWAQDARDSWERAIALCLQLRAGAGSRLEEIESSLIVIFDTALPASGSFGLSVARLIYENNFGRDRARQTGDSLASRGTDLARTGRDFEARGYLDAAMQWYGRAGEKELQADVTCAVAETWANEATARSSASQPSNMVAASFYENAIQTYRRVPRTLRTTRRVEERMVQLHALLDAAGKASLEEMGVISSGPIDVSELVKAAQAAVRGKELPDALFALANIYRGARKSKLKESSEKTLREHPLQALFASTHMSRDGRVVAKRPAMGLSSTESEEYRLTLQAEMVKHYSMELGLIVQSQLWPALEAFSLDHRIREADLVHIVSNSPIVPDGRATLITKGLLAGFERDLVSALHLLVPQVEHIVRWHLKSAGVKTTTLSSDGIENENGLSTLVDMPEVVSIFGEDLAFEMKALFCDAFGPNLRNEVAHGLLDAPSCQTAQTFYAWWFVLRLTFNTFWNAARKSGQEAPPQSESPNREPADEI